MLDFVWALFLNGCVAILLGKCYLKAIFVKYTPILPFYILITLYMTLQPAIIDGVNPD